MKCDICEINVTNESHLEKHMKKHKNVNIVETSASVRTLSETEGVINVHECESCKEKFSSAGDLLFHVENNHKEAAVKFLKSALKFLVENDYNLLLLSVKFLICYV